MSRIIYSCFSVVTLSAEKEIMLLILCIFVICVMIDTCYNVVNIGGPIQTVEVFLLKSRSFEKMLRVYGSHKCSD